MTEPRTAAGRALLHYADNIERALHPVMRQPTKKHVCACPDACDLILEMPMHVKAIEDDASPDSALRKAAQRLAYRAEAALDCYYGGLEEGCDHRGPVMESVAEVRAALASGSPTPILPPADYPQVDHPWAGSEDGHNCETCIAADDHDHKCDRLAHVNADLQLVAATEANRVAAENLRRYGGIAGPGLRGIPGAALSASPAGRRVKRDE